MSSKKLKILFKAWNINSSDPGYGSNLVSDKQPDSFPSRGGSQTTISWPLGAIKNNQIISWLAYLEKQTATMKDAD